MSSFTLDPVSGFTQATVKFSELAVLMREKGRWGDGLSRKRGCSDRSWKKFEGLASIADLDLSV